ncbi:MAG: tetratricopeptide repeat protein [Betaproteobacteria bacterium]|nr:tetratricopeptide repeat protein [Betaproteobacteria bacterium]
MSIDAEQALRRAVTLHRAGELREAERLYRAVLRANPRHGYGWMALGALLGAQGRLPEALPVLVKSVELLPADADAHGNLAHALREFGRLSEALPVQQKCVALRPSDPLAHNDLGNALMDLGRPAEAEASFRHALELDSGFSEALCNLGLVRQKLGDPSEAQSLFRRAIELNPGLSEAHNNLGSVLQDLGRWSEAEASYRRALQLRPGYHEAHSNLGNVLRELRRFPEAEASFRRALKLKPDSPGTHSNLANVLHDLGRLSEAEASCRDALEIDPDFPEAHSNLADVLRDLGRFTEAQASCRRALELKPDFRGARSNLLFLMAYSGVGTPGDYLAQARQWEISAVAQEARTAAKAKRFVRAPRQNRALRIGYVSGDLGAHVVSLNIEGVLEAHDRSRVEVFAYPASGIRGEVTDRIRRSTDHWHSVTGLSDDAAVDLISAHEIDVLVDLSGHTAHNRLGVFARRAAPIQCHYLGYFASTGISEMDYWIGDRVLIPPAHGDHFSEKVWRLPRVWISYAAPGQGPDPVWQPGAGGKVCLGSFNQLAKMTERTVSLWARVLHRIPNAYLLLKTKQLDDPANRSSILAAFARHGVPASRIELLGRTADPAAHLSLYCRLDVALDPAGGITGGITTSEALWMGTPVVTLAGRRAGERLTTAILAGIGHEEWTASDEDNYVEKVAQLAANPALRQGLRHSLRPAMRAGPFCDPSGMARALEDAFESMFDRWSLHADDRPQAGRSH